MRPLATRPARAAVIAIIITVLAVYFGSREFRDFDASLIGYAVATTFAIGALTYRYSRWIGRPPTWRYFKGGWVNFLSWKNFRRYTFLIPRSWWTDIFAQTFILKRSVTRWIMHLCIFWGVILSLLITIPLSFGWIHFTLVPPGHYKMWVVGIPVFSFPIHATIGFGIFHALDITAAILIIGLCIAIYRRLTNVGLLATQRFSFDLMPIVLLMAIAVTGLLLTASYDWWGGRFFWFMSLTHEVVVVAWLISLPFGKFFHIIERPASIGVTLYQQVNQDVDHYGSHPRVGTGTCRRCGQELPSRQFVSDLEGVLADLGQNYDMGEGNGKLQDYCPTCKRVIRGASYYDLMGRRFL